MNKKTIKNKIKSTQSIKKITRTMEMVSVAKMKKSLNLAESYKTFGLEAKRVLSILAEQREKHVYSTAKDSEVKLLIVIAGQKGLCGGYNSNVYRKISREYKTEAERGNLRFICIGKYAEKIARRFDSKIKTPEKEISENPSNIILSFIGKDFTSSNSRALIKNITGDFVENKYKSVELIYTDFENVNTQVVTREILLPFKTRNIKDFDNDKSASNTDNLEYTFEPSVNQVYAYTVNILLQNIIVGSVFRARAAEHAARMMAMKTASDNATEMISELKLWYNKARQAAITQEIAEISSAAMAMQEK